MESDQTFIQKTFQMINQLTGQTHFIPVKVLYLPNSREINVSRAIGDIHSNGNNISNKGLSLTNSHIFYLDISKRLFVHMGTFPFKQQIFLKFELFLQTTIKIRFRKIHSDSNSPKNQSKNVSQVQTSSIPLPKQKKQQKQIKTVVQLVHKWKDMIKKVDLYGKKIFTLESAALKLGISKRTLDDYYYQITNAQAYGFDFQKFKQEKIGFLRQFIKNCIKNKVPKKVIKSDQNSQPTIVDIDQFLISFASSSDSQSDHQSKPK